MNVGDLVTLSAAGRNIDRIIMEHKRYFKGPDSNYYSLCSADKKRFNEYWENDKIIGLITQVERMPISGYSWEKREYIQTGERISYLVVWQANPKPLKADRHLRSHLKFVKKKKTAKK